MVLIIAVWLAQGHAPRPEPPIAITTRAVVTQRKTKQKPHSSFENLKQKRGKATLESVPGKAVCLSRSVLVSALGPLRFLHASAMPRVVCDEGRESFGQQAALLMGFQACTP